MQQDTPDTPTRSKKSLSDLARAEDDISTTSMVVEIARSIILVLVLSTALSYFITGDSLVWNVKRPRFTYPAYIRSIFVCWCVVYLRVALTCLRRSLSTLPMQSSVALMEAIRNSPSTSPSMGQSTTSVPESASMGKGAHITSLLVWMLLEPL